MNYRERHFRLRAEVLTVFLRRGGSFYNPAPKWPAAAQQ
jgi:hypothetical protein